MFFEVVFVILVHGYGSDGVIDQALFFKIDQAIIECFWISFVDEHQIAQINSTMNFTQLVAVKNSDRDTYM